jgi:hypothetical protein
MIEFGVPLLYDGGEDQQNRLTPPAESSGGSSSRRLADSHVTHKFLRQGMI